MATLRTLSPPLPCSEREQPGNTADPDLEKYLSILSVSVSVFLITIKGFLKKTIKIKIRKGTLLLI